MIVFSTITTALNAAIPLVLTSNQPLEVWAKQAGLDWQIEESPVRFITNAGGPLGEIPEFYRDLTEVSGFELETAGVLKGGRKMWALARTGQFGVLKGSGQTNGYVLKVFTDDTKEGVG